MALSGWCSQHGIPNCADCRWDGCSHECHQKPTESKPDGGAT